MMCPSRKWKNQVDNFLETASLARQLANSFTHQTHDERYVHNSYSQLLIFILEIVSCDFLIYYQFSQAYHLFVCLLFILIHLFTTKVMVVTHSQSRFLKAVDRFNDLVVSAYVTAGHILFYFFILFIFYFICFIFIFLEVIPVISFWIVIWCA